MKRGKYQSARKPTNRYWGILLFILLLGIGIIVYLFLRPSQTTPLPDGSSYTEPADVVKNPDSIAIPGYEAINLKANARQQNIALPNPAQNVCYFQITLLLEDGTILWRSKLIKPGTISDPIVLTQELETGTYRNACLKYECYTMDGNMTSLNGAETKLALIVS